MVNVFYPNRIRTWLFQLNKIRADNVVLKSHFSCVILREKNISGIMLPLVFNIFFAGKMCIIINTTPELTVSGLYLHFNSDELYTYENHNDGNL